MQEEPSKKIIKKTNLRHQKLQTRIGNAFKLLRKKQGYTNYEHFANAQELNRSQYGKYEAGSTNMTIGALLDIGIALGLNEEDIFNEEFLNLGKNEDDANKTLSSSQTNTINQVNDQVKEAIGEIEASKLDSDDLKRLYEILVAAQNPISKKGIITKLGLSSKTPNFETIFNLAKSTGWLNMTHPDIPNANNQKYYTTASGRKVLKLG